MQPNQNNESLNNQKNRGIDEGEKNWRFDPKAGEQKIDEDSADSELSADSDSDEEEDFANAGAAADESTDDAEDVTGNQNIQANQNQRDSTSKSSKTR